MGKSTEIPAHVAIIMDGNGRWAQQRGRERIWGHANGVESVRAALRAAVRHGVRYLTLYAFSTENWGRPREEVDTLMELLCDSVVRECPELIAQGVRVRMIGDRAELPGKVIGHIERAERETVDGEALTLMLAVNYSSKSELVHAVRFLAQQAADRAIDPQQITGRTIESQLYTYPCPDPDLLIRTGGEQRLSNFMLWQAAYAELYFTQTLWPDFREEDFDRALDAYAERNRRFGLINDQK